MTVLDRPFLDRPFAGLPARGPKPPTNAPTGSSDAPTGSGGVSGDPAAAPADSPIGHGPASQCEPYREAILAKLEAGLSVKRIHQDLAAEAITVHDDSLWRYVRRLGRTRPLPFRRIECEPGEEAQVDFGTGAPVVSAEGKRRKTYVFRIVLSHSRKGYSEAT